MPNEVLKNKIRELEGEVKNEIKTILTLTGFGAGLSAIGYAVYYTFNGNTATAMFDKLLHAGGLATFASGVALALAGVESIFDMNSHRKELERLKGLLRCQEEIHRVKLQH